MKQRSNFLKISTPAKLLKTIIDPEVDIPVFEEAFDIKELKQFYRDRDSTSTFSPKSSISPGKNTPTGEKISGLGQVPLGCWSKDLSFKIKLQKLAGSNENGNLLLVEYPWDKANHTTISTIEDDSKMKDNEKASKKITKRHPFIIIRNYNKKLKISDTSGIEIKLSSSIQEKIVLNPQIVNNLNKTQNNCQVKKKRIWFTIERKSKNE